MTDDAENYLGYIKDGDEAKRDAYVSKMDASEQESEKHDLEQEKKNINALLKTSSLYTQGYIINKINKFYN